MCCALLLMLCSGCLSQPYALFEGGTGTREGLSKYVNFRGEEVEITQFGVRLGGTIWDDPDGLALDLQGGPSFTVPTAGETGRGYSLEGAFRLRVTDSEDVQPYALFGLGVLVFDEQWSAQATSWGFTVNFGFGTLLKLTERTRLVMEYRYWHESNGSALFGSPRPNPGYDSDMIFFGFQVDL